MHDLIKNKGLFKLITDKLAKLPDIERILSKIFTYSVKGKIKAFYIDANALNRLDEFYQLLKVFEEMIEFIAKLNKDWKSKLKSDRLSQLITLQSDSNGLFPDY